MDHSIRRRWLTGAGAIVAVATLALTGCSASSPADTSTDGASSGAPAELTPVTLQLQWYAQAQFAGYYAALDQGYFEDEGLDVTILEGAADIVPIDVLASGDADYAISWVPKVLGSIEAGTNVTDVAQIFERSGTTQVSFKDAGIEGPADLAGKNVGSWGYGNEWELIAGMNAAGVDLADVNYVSQAFDMSGLLAGDIDAAQAMTYNEYAQLLETVNPDTGELYTADDFNVINWSDEGQGMLQDAIWADTDRLASDSDYADTTVKFIKAAIKGWIYARDHVQETADLVVAAGTQLGASHQLWQTNEVNKLIWPSTSGIGMINADEWANTVDIAKTATNPDGATVITTDPPDTAYSNEYVTKALDELKADGEDVMGADYAPIDVTLTEGGN